MAHTYTVDASVWMSAFNPYEQGHRDSNRLLARLQAQAVPIIVPTLLLPEVAAAVRWGREDESLALEFAETLQRLRHLVWVPLDDVLAHRAAGVAARHQLRGSDAVYVAVALRFGSDLITRDRQQRERVEGVLEAWHPAEFLEQAGKTEGFSRP